MLRGFDARVGYIAALGRNDTPGIELERGDDVAVAAGYTVQVSPVDIRGGLQAIHRLKNSTATDGAGGRTEITNSAGTQVNVQLGATWQADEHWNLGLDAALGLMKRQENAGVDGLTRSRSIALQAQFSW
jgi:outer membrane autotransporter protein